MSGQAPAEQMIVNYDDVWAYEPQQFRIGDVELWNRGIPRAALGYGFALLAFLLFVGQLPVVGAPLQMLGRFQLPASVLLSVGISWWAWKLPPGGVVPHKAASAVLRGTLAPRRLHGWVPVGAQPRDWVPDDLPIEPDGREQRCPDLQFTGPGLVVVGRPSQELVHHARWFHRLPGAGRGRTARTYVLGAAGGATGRALEIPAGITVRFREETP